MTRRREENKKKRIRREEEKMKKKERGEEEREQETEKETELASGTFQTRISARPQSHSTYKIIKIIKYKKVQAS